MKHYLLGLLDGSHTVSNEGIGLVIERLEKLEVALKLAESFLNEDELLMHQYYRIKDNCDDEKIKCFNEKEEAWQNALSALGGGE